MHCHGDENLSSRTVFKLHPPLISSQMKRLKALWKIIISIDGCYTMNFGRPRDLSRAFGVPQTRRVHLMHSLYHQKQPSCKLVVGFPSRIANPSFWVSCLDMTHPNLYWYITTLLEAIWQHSCLTTTHLKRRYLTTQ